MCMFVNSSSNTGSADKTCFVCGQLRKSWFPVCLLLSVFLWIVLVSNCGFASSSHDFLAFPEFPSNLEDLASLLFKCSLLSTGPLLDGNCRDFWQVLEGPLKYQTCLELTHTQIDDR